MLFGGVAEGTTAGAVAALAAGALLIGPVRTLGLFMVAGALLLTLAADAVRWGGVSC